MLFRSCLPLKQHLGNSFSCAFYSPCFISSKFQDSLNQNEVTRWQHSIRSDTSGVTRQYSLDTFHSYHSICSILISQILTAAISVPAKISGCVKVWQKNLWILRAISTAFIEIFSSIFKPYQEEVRVSPLLRRITVSKCHCLSTFLNNFVVPLRHTLLLKNAYFLIFIKARNTS